MTKRTRKLNIAMIGAGFMGRAHSNAYHQAGHFFEIPHELELKVVCSRNREIAEDFAAQWGWQEAQTDWRSVVTRNDIDVVDICTPNCLHAPIAIAASEAGKMVLCEKPLAMNYGEARRMAEAARNVRTLVWFNYRRVPAIAFAKQLIDKGKVGQPYHYRATYLQSWGRDPNVADAWRFRLSEAGSGVMGDLLSHSLDLALMLNGRISELVSAVKTFTPNREVEDAAWVLARFANGSVGTFEATRFATGCLNRTYFEIHGSNGAIRFNLEDLNRLEVFDCSNPAELQGFHNLLVTGADHPYAKHFWPPGHILGYEHTFIATLVDFLECVATDEIFHPNFDDAAEVQRLLDAVEESARNGSWTKVIPPGRT